MIILLLYSIVFCGLLFSVCNKTIVVSTGIPRYSHQHDQYSWDGRHHLATLLLWVAVPLLSGYKTI